ncbi:MAG: hypothetical protein WCX90_01835 [Thiohalomonadaceae bacterium]
MSERKKTAVATAIFGVSSLVLYLLLFVYSDQLVLWAEQTRQGQKVLFLVPIVIAFVFSWVHGSFTGYFWELLGVRAAAKSK